MLEIPGAIQSRDPAALQWDLDPPVGRAGTITEIPAAFRGDHLLPCPLQHWDLAGISCVPSSASPNQTSQGSSCPHTLPRRNAGFLSLSRAPGEDTSLTPPFANIPAGNWPQDLALPGLQLHVHWSSSAHLLPLAFLKNPAVLVSCFTLLGFSGGYLSSWEPQQLMEMAGASLK